MKTREQIYGVEATELLRIITTYHSIRHDQLLKFFPEKEKKIENLLSYLTKQGRIFYEAKADLYHDGTHPESAFDMVSALWVLSDFVAQAEFHSSSDFPISLVFVADGELYEVIYIAAGKEALVEHALSQAEKDAEKRIVILETTDQIEKLDLEGVTAYCTVDAQTGNVSYFKPKDKEDCIG